MAFHIGHGQVFEFDAQHRALNAVHSGVPADLRMVIFLVLPVVSQNLNFSRQFLVVGDYATRFAQGAEVLAGIETETSRNAHRAGMAAFVESAVRLAGVFNDGNAMSSGNFQDGVHVSALAKEMNGNDRFGLGSNGFLPVSYTHLRAHETGR